MLLTIGFLLSWWAQCLRFLKISVSTLFFFFPDQRCCQHFIAIIILESPALYLSYTHINCICHHHHFCNCAPRLHGSTERPRVLDPKLVGAPLTERRMFVSLIVCIYQINKYFSDFHLILASDPNINRSLSLFIMRVPVLIGLGIQYKRLDVDLILYSCVCI